MECVPSFVPVTNGGIEGWGPHVVPFAEHHSGSLAAASSVVNQLSNSTASVASIFGTVATSIVVICQLMTSVGEP